MKDAFEDGDVEAVQRRVLEKDVESKSCAIAEAAGWWQSKFRGASSRSLPDRIFCKNGFVFACEFKAPGEEPTEAQLLKHKEMRDAGWVVVWCDSVAMFEGVLVEMERFVP